MAIVQMIRRAYPGAYDDMTDAELEQRVAKAPGAVRLKLARAMMDVQSTSAARDKGLDDPLSPDFQALRAKGEMEGTAAAAGPSLSILGSTALMGAIPAALAVRGGGAMIGGAEGYRKGGVPGAVVGGVAGALKPGVTGTVGGAMQGYEAGGIPGAVVGAGLGALMGGGKGQIMRDVTTLRGAAGAPAATAAAESAAVTTTAAPKAVASEAAATADEIAAQIIKWKTEQGFSGAQIISSLRNVYGIPPKDANKMVQMVTANLPKSPLRAPRIEVGAERVGKASGMSKEEVRTLTGPVVGEAVGAASPVFPQKAFDTIYAKMRAMPRGGPERMAYAAAAKGEKAMSQVETIRRTLEASGLVVPAAAIAEAIRRKEDEEI